MQNNAEYPLLSRRQKFLLLNSIAFILLFSWFYPPGHLLWLKLDEKAFFFLNGWLANSRTSQLTWAVTNFRGFDLFAFFLMVIPFIFPGLVFDAAECKKHIITLITLMAVLVSARFLLNYTTGVHRNSPSLVLKPAYLLHELVSYIPAKDKAHDSFPGDHAAVVLCWMFYLIMVGKKHWRAYAVILGGLLMLPRLVAGAHWLSDDLVGGVFLALFSIAWVCCTPLAHYAIIELMPIANFSTTKLCPRWLSKIAYSFS